MILRVCAFTERGWRLVDRLEAVAPDEIVERRADETLNEWVGESFAARMPVLFVGACGIAVRAIAPFVKDKTLDSPVVVIDEFGRFVIPLLSGHCGGANRLAEQLACKLGATCVTTTATDVNALFAVDVFASENALRVCNPGGIVKVSSKILRGAAIDVAVEPGISLPDEEVPSEIRLREFPPTTRVDVLIAESPETYDVEASLRLSPKPFVLGIGCKKGTSAETIKRLALEGLATLGVPERWDLVAAVASVDKKRREYGLVRFASEIGSPFLTYAPEELNKVLGEFTSSKFVCETIGVDNVCERAATLAAGKGAELVLRKTIGAGATLAIARRKAVIARWKKRSLS
ncbi:MAG: cobalt-precorrin 5A hydrolase [Thermoguttaceae bacterium]|jgi:cobalt-precorrin 5A hydrolase